MSRINHENIDKWLFDLSEGNLNSFQKRELNSFLQAHPEYQLDLDSWSQAHLREEQENVAPVAYEAELLAIAQPLAWKRYAAVATLLIAIGAASLAVFDFGWKHENTYQQRTAALISTEEHAAAFLQDEAPAETVDVPSENNVRNATAFNSHNNIQAAQRRNHLQHAAQRRSPVDDRRHDVLVPEEYATEWGLNQEVQAHTVNPQEEIVQTQVTSVLNSEEHLAEEITLPRSETPQLVHVFNQYRPEIKSEEYGQLMAKTALDIEKAKINAPEKIELLNPHPEIAAENKSHSDLYKKRKKFHENSLGLFNTRDHQLLHPGNLATAEYAAFAATSVSPSLSLNYRNQWSSAGHGSQSGKMVFTQYSKKMKSAWGIGFSSSLASQGLHSIHAGSLYFSPKIRINKNFQIEPGISATYYQNAVSRDPLSNWGMIEPVRGIYGYPLSGNGIRRVNQGLDISISTLVNTKYFYFAGGIDHILHPALNVYNGEIPVSVSTPMRFKLVAGTDFKRFHESKILFSPQMSINLQGEVKELWAGTMARINWLTMGAAASQNGQFMGTLGVHSRNFRISYNFDVTKSYMNDMFYASHEISLRMGLSGLSRKPSAILNQPK